MTSLLHPWASRLPAAVLATFFVGGARAAPDGVGSDAPLAGASPLGYSGPGEPPSKTRGWEVEAAPPRGAEVDAPAPRLEGAGRCRVLGSTGSERVALVLGNGRYAQPIRMLTNPGYDAEGMAGALRELDFSVHVGLDVGIAQARACLEGFGKQARSAEVALVFYAGHGVEIAGDNYLVSVDPPKGPDPRRTSLGLDRILRATQGARTRVIILDACREDPLRGRTDARDLQVAAADTKGWKAIDANAGTLVAYGTAPGAFALDTPKTIEDIGNHAPFTHALLENMKVEGLEMAELMRRVTRRVRELTEDEQQPWLSSSYTEAFYFVPPREGVVSRFEATSQPPADVVGWRDRGVQAYKAKRFEEAKKYLEKAALAGHPDAQFYFAQLYIQGWGGLDEDKSEAAYWLELAAGRGHALAQYVYGRFLIAGWGPQGKKEKMGADLVERAAEQGHAPAMFILGRLYEKGRARAKSRAQAVRWYHQARAHGSREGFEALRRLGAD